MNMKEYVVRRSETGSVDVDATIAKFAGELQSYLNGVETLSDSIGVAVEQVFDAHKGASIPLPALVSIALTALGVSPTNFTEMSEAVADYVRSHKDVYQMSKGKGGGVRRIADIPPKTDDK